MKMFFFLFWSPAFDPREHIPQCYGYPKTATIFNVQVMSELAYGKIYFVLIHCVLMVAQVKNSFKSAQSELSLMLIC